MTSPEAKMILVVDKEPPIVRLLTSFLTARGYQSTSVTSAAEAGEWIKNNTAHIILVDLDTGGDDGARHLLEMLRIRGGMSQIVAMSASPTVDKVIEAYHLGASDYLTKPFKNMDIVSAAISQASERLARWRSILSLTLAEEGLS